MKPNRYDHDMALKLAWSGQLNDEDVNICNIIAGGYITSTDVSDDHIKHFRQIETQYDFG